MNSHYVLTAKYNYSLLSYVSSKKDCKSNVVRDLTFLNFYNCHFFMKMSFFFLFVRRARTRMSQGKCRTDWSIEKWIIFQEGTLSDFQELGNLGNQEERGGYGNILCKRELSGQL